MAGLKMFKNGFENGESVDSLDLSDKNLTGEKKNEPNANHDHICVSCPAVLVGINKPLKWGKKFEKSLKP